MSESRAPKAAGGGGPSRLDADLELRGIGAFAVGLALTMIVLLLAVWMLLARFRAVQVARDPRPSPLAAAGVPRLPPEPRLQTSEPADMLALRAAEDAVLGSYGWVDRSAGIARIPIGRAMEILESGGLPAAPPPAAVASDTAAGNARRPSGRPAGPPRHRRKP